MGKSKRRVRLVNEKLNGATTTVPLSTATVLTKGDRGWDYVDPDDKPTEAEATEIATDTAAQPPVPSPAPSPTPTRNRPTAGAPGQEA